MYLASTQIVRIDKNVKICFNAEFSAVTISQNLTVFLS